MSTQNPISKKIFFSNEGKIKTFLYEVKQRKMCNQQSNPKRMAKGSSLKKKIILKNKRNIRKNKKHGKQNYGQRTLLSLQN